MNEMELDERKTKILRSIIKNYLETGEPVGSRTISKILDLQLSSATIRNEMSDLEEMGYIIQPHTSAGRIPSDKGYRFYVDQLMIENESQVSEMKEYVIEKTERMEKVLQQVVKLLATNTNYATMITSPSISGTKVKFIQLSAVDSEQILAVIVMEGNIVKNKIIPISEPLANETILKLNMLLNTTLNGIPFEQINLGLITRLKEQAGAYGNIISEVLDAIATALREDEDLEVYTSGANNLIKYPELFDSGSAGDAKPEARFHKAVRTHGIPSAHQIAQIIHRRHQTCAGERELPGGNHQRHLRRKGETPYPHRHHQNDKPTKRNTQRHDRSNC